MKQYNGSDISFLSEASKRLVNLTQKINVIIGLVNNQDSFSYNFTEAVELFKKKENVNLDNFCCDETLAHYLHKKEPLLTTAEDREIYYLALRNHLLRLVEKGEL